MTTTTAASLEAPSTPPVTDPAQQAEATGCAANANADQTSASSTIPSTGDQVKTKRQKYLGYACPVDICDVLGCPNFAVTVVSAPGVEGGHLNICDEHLADIESGGKYVVDPHARKLLLSEKPSE